MPKLSIRRFLRWLLVGLGVVVAAIVATPLGRYILRAAWEEAKILSRRQSIENVIADAATDPALKERLRLVLAARAYAIDTLGLEAGESFTAFAQLDRDTLVLLISAAYRDRLEAYRWWFPIVGRLPYKGFFDPDDARRARDDFQRRGFDTYLRPASAFSTLGWFNDPLLSTTLRLDSINLANTVIHEVTHNTFFKAGEAVFNESFANFVGARGAEAFFLARGDTAAARETVLRWEDEKLLASYWTRLYETLDSAYKAHPADRNARLAARDTVYGRARAELIGSIGPRLRTMPARYAERVALDNAALLARRIYLTDLELFDRVHRREGGSLPRTIERIIGLAKDAKGDPFAAVTAWLGAGAGS